MEIPSKADDKNNKVFEVEREQQIDFDRRRSDVNKLTAMA
jgi:hypothetical protein